jgi:phosphatidylserine/phosphatidylglycerophosphate/cardiolipin synthase-like enzyme
VNDVAVSVYFAPEDNVIEHLVELIDGAQTSVRFMAFSFTENVLGAAVLRAGERGIDIAGVFETTGSLTEYSEMRPLFCAGMDVRQDGNPFILHHKVMIIDSETVVVGSFNFSGNATESNDENLVVIQDPTIAAQYLVEYERIYNQGAPPEDVTCN